MLNLIAALPPFKNATVKIARDENMLDIVILIGKRPKPVALKE
jgi:hypothetical protein